MPLAGKLGTLGQKILSDFKNARQLTDYDWEKDCLMTEQIPRAVLGKKAPNKVIPKLNELSFDNETFRENNFGILHQTAQYPSHSSSKNGNGNNNSLRAFNMTLQGPFEKFEKFDKSPVKKAALG